MFIYCVDYLMTLLQDPHRAVRLLAANLSALWVTPLATGANGAGFDIMGAGLGAAGAQEEGLGMYTGGGGADWGSACIFTVVVVVLLGSNLSAKLVSDTQGGRLPEEAGPPGAGAEAAGGGWG